MNAQPRPSEIEWHEVKCLYPCGSSLMGTVSAIVPFGLIVALPSSPVVGVVLAPGFDSAAAFQRRRELYPLGVQVGVRVLGYSEGRLQVDLMLESNGEKESQ